MKYKSKLCILLILLLPSAGLVGRQFENAASDSFPDVDKVLVGRNDEFVHQLRPVQVHLVHPLVLQLGDAQLDVLLDGLDVSVEFLPVTSLELESRAGQLFEVLGTPHVLRVVLGTGLAATGEPV